MSTIYINKFCPFIGQQCFDSYLNEEYKEMSVEKKSSLFEREGEYCSNKTIKSMYYCVAAVIRLETFVEEWLVNGFDNYKSTLSEFKQECLVKGLNNITISRGILSEDKEYLFIEGTLLMLKEFWIELNNDANSYIDNYGNLLTIEKEEANLFNYEWLGKLFKLSYDVVLDHCNNNEDQVAAAEKEYLESVAEMLEDYGKIGPRERKRLEKERIHLGISEERAQQLEVELLKPSLTEEEQEYLEEFQEMLEDYDEIGVRERKRLEKSRVRLGISEARAKELEKL